jgi:hypothetical protein
MTFYYSGGSGPAGRPRKAARVLRIVGAMSLASTNVVRLGIPSSFPFNVWYEVRVAIQWVIEPLL